MRVVGTAGHVDHGKSTLIEALTGIHPDRLKEERAREMTIDLGFAWMDLPDGETVGIVDVPGHRDFIENMLAGIGGIDAAIFVVAADEGVMPQSREHLAILDILQIPGGVIALTKIDMIDDPDWLDLIEEDVRQVIRDTVLENAPFVRVSARSGQGLPEMVRVLSNLLSHQPIRPDLGRPRLPIDRVFTMPGFGTIVTGTLTDGVLNIGDELEILPSRMRGRVRGLQSHNQKENLAVPGSRTAINISGVDVDQVARGDVVTLPGKYQPTQMLDVHFRLLPDVSASLKHNTEVKLFIGTAEVLSRLRLLGSEELSPGQTGWLQLELREPVVALRGDRYILRRPSPGETLGGGIVVDPRPTRRHKRFDETIISRLEAYQQGTPAEILLQASQAIGAMSMRELISRARLESDQALEAIQELVSEGQLIPLEAGNLTQHSDLLVVSIAQWNLLSRQIQDILEQYHRQYPLRKGMPREELKSRLKLPARLFNAVMRKCNELDILIEAGITVRRPDHQIRLSPLQTARVNALLGRFDLSPYSPPGLKESEQEVGEEVLNTLIESGQLVQVSQDVVFQRKDYDHMLARVRQHFEREPTITVAQFRDQFNTSRRYALAFLEHLDSSGITTRDGDYRRLRKPFAA
jgi:selenocysteine-specific elongation factor